MSEVSQARVLSEIFSDFYLLATQIQAGTIELPAPEPLRNRLMSLFESTRKRALDRGFTASDAEDAQYAVAALLDETIQFSDWPGKQDLSAYPLQRALFGESIAGANFFDRLADARRRDSAAIEVYYICLGLGFRGQYHIDDQESLQELMRDLRQTLTKGDKRKIAPHGGRPEEAAMAAKRLPLIPLALISLLLALLVTGALHIVLSSARVDAVEIIRQMARN